MLLARAAGATLQKSVSILLGTRSTSSMSLAFRCEPAWPARRAVRPRPQRPSAGAVSASALGGRVSKNPSASCWAPGSPRPRARGARRPEPRWAASPTRPTQRSARPAPPRTAAHGRVRRPRVHHALGARQPVDGQPELGAPRTESDGVFGRCAPSGARRRAAPKRTSKSTGDSPRGSPSMAHHRVASLQRRSTLQLFLARPRLRPARHRAALARAPS